MSTAGNIGEALKRSLSYLAPEARAEIQKLINPETLAIVAAVLVGWVGSHAFGVGEIVDLVLLTLGILAIGLSVFEGIDELYLFAKLAINAASPQDLDAAGKHFARAVAVLGIQAILAVLLKGAPKTFRGGRINIGQVPSFVEGPVSRPPLVSTRAMRAGEGRCSGRCSVATEFSGRSCRNLVGSASRALFLAVWPMRSGGLPLSQSKHRSLELAALVTSSTVPRPQYRAVSK
jgi:hypothetical protein